MPIRILNSGVDLGADPNTCSTVVFRDHSGVVCRTSANPHQHRKTRRQSQQQLARKAMQDTGGRGGGGGGGGVASSVIAPGCERQLTPVGAAPVGVGVGDGIEGGGRASSPYDMTSIFGLEVHRLKEEELEAQNKRKNNKSSGAHNQERHDTDGNTKGQKTPATPGATTADAAKSSGQQQQQQQQQQKQQKQKQQEDKVWISRSGGAARKPLPAQAALKERVRQGNGLVKSVRAGRSLRQATRSATKEALELGLWAASRPEEFVKTNLTPRNKEPRDKSPPEKKCANSPGRTEASTGKPRLSGEGGSSDDSDGGGNAGLGSVGGNDRVRALEGKLRAIDQQLAGRRGRRASTPRHDWSTGGREERDRSNALHTGFARGSAAPSSIGSGVAGTPRAHGSSSPSAGMARGAGGAGGAGRTSEARGSKGRVLSSSGGGAGLGAGSEQGATSARGGDEGKKASVYLGIAAVGDGRRGASNHSPPGGSLTSRSAPPAATGGPRGRRVAAGGAASGPLSARRASPDAPVVVSTAVQKELREAVRDYVLRQTGLDDALSETIRGRDFDWDTDMRRMMGAIQIAAAGEGTRTFESVSTVIRRQVLAKKRKDEARNLKGCWFPSVLKRMLIVVGDKEGGEMPPCMAKLAAGLHKVLVNGNTVSPSLFWSLVAASFLDEDHRERAGQKMILACLTFVRQRPEDYHRFLLDRSVKISGSLKQVFLKAQRRATNVKKASKKSSLGRSSSSLKLGGMEGQLGAAGARDAIGYSAGGRCGGMSVVGSDASDDASDSMSIASGMSRETSVMGLVGRR